MSEANVLYRKFSFEHVKTWKTETLPCPHCADEAPKEGLVCAACDGAKTITRKIPDAKWTWSLLRPKVEDVEGSYANYLAAEVARGIELIAPTVSKRFYQNCLEIWGQRFIDGSYSWKQPKWYASFEDDKNLEEFLWLWFSQRDNIGPKIERIDFHNMVVERREDLVRLINDMLGERNPTPAPSANGAKL